MKKSLRLLATILLVALLVSSLSVAFAVKMKIKSGGGKVYNKNGQVLARLHGGTAVSGYFKTVKVKGVKYNLFVITSRKFKGQQGAVRAYSLAMPMGRYAKITKQCNLRSSATAKANNIKHELTKGTKVYMVKYRNGFVYCKTPKGNGWVYYSYLSPT